MFSPRSKYVGYKRAKYWKHMLNLRHILVSPTHMLKNKHLLQHMLKSIAYRGPLQKKKIKSFTHWAGEGGPKLGYKTACSWETSGIKWFFKWWSHSIFLLSRVFNGKKSMSWLIFQWSFIFICRQMALLLNCSAERLWSISVLHCYTIRGFFTLPLISWPIICWTVKNV